MGLLINSFKFREATKSPIIFDLDTIRFFVMDQNKNILYVYSSNSGYPHRVATTPKEVELFIAKFRKKAILIGYESKDNTINIFENAKDFDTLHNFDFNNEKGISDIPIIYINENYIKDYYVDSSDNNMGILNIYIDSYMIHIKHTMKDKKDKVRIWTDYIL